MAGTFRTWDDYFIPGTEVLRNKLTAPGLPYGETDAAKLREAEEAVTNLRLQELAAEPLEGNFDYDHMKAIHHHIFQDVYEWAGQERVAPVGEFMSKEGHNYYPAGPGLAEAAEAEYRKIASSDLLRGMEPEPFVAELAERWGELNVVHSFREGNTRSQLAFFTQLSKAAGYDLDTEALRPGRPLRDEFVAARFHGQDTGNNKPLAAVLGQVVTPSSAAAASPSRSALRPSYPRSANETLREAPRGTSPKARHEPPTPGRSDDRGRD